MENVLRGFSMDLYLMDKYSLTPAHLLFIKMLLLARESMGQDDVEKYFEMDEALRGDGRDLKEITDELKESGVIDKEWQFPKEGEMFYPNEVKFTKKFIKHFSKESLEMGKELYDIYPLSCVVNGIEYKLRRISKKFDSLEEAFYRYAKDLGFSTEKHEEVLRLVKEGKLSGYQFSTLDAFIVDRDYLNIKAVSQEKVLSDNIRML